MFTIRHSIPCLPVPLQGPSTDDKTPLVDLLAQLTGEKLEKINNNEHTDFFEYIGDVLTPDGTLEFRGPVVQPARSGEWIALDELNLAPPDVLEALNRRLDDNRENRIPETGEVVRAAPGFVILATQNPPGLYGGRKELCQASSGRFIEKDVNDSLGTQNREQEN
jgi:midasin